MMHPPMIVTTPSAFLSALDERERQATTRAAPTTMAAALLVHPRGFRVSGQSVDNVYMTVGPVDSARAVDQHHALIGALERCGLPVLVFPGRPDLEDGVFPNNAFATRPGRLIVGSMCHPIRQGETRREDIRRFFRDVARRTIVDLSTRALVAELTGPLIIDHRRSIGYCGMSQRVDEAGCAAMHEAFELALTYRFDLKPDEYHTNVVMSVLAGRALVIHPGSFADPAVPEAIAKAYPDRVLTLSDEEKLGFAGNCIALTERDVLLSKTAFDTLRPASRAALEGWGFTLHPVDVSEFEKAGGSVRCMVCEVF